MPADRRTLLTTFVKLFLTSAWIVIVALASQNFVAQRTTAESSTALLRRATAIRERASTQSYLPDGDYQIVNGPFLDAGTAAESVDRSVKSVGLAHVRIAPTVYQRYGFDLTVDLLKRGYHDEDLLILTGVSQ